MHHYDSRTYSRQIPEQSSFVVRAYHESQGSRGVVCITRISVVHRAELAGAPKLTRHLSQCLRPAQGPVVIEGIRTSIQSKCVEGGNDNYVDLTMSDNF